MINNKMASSNSQLAMTNEDQPLLERKPSYFRILKTRYRNTHKCISSKAALLILFWSFVIYMIYAEVYFNGILYMHALNIINYSGTFLSPGIIYNTGNAFIDIFCPFAGFLADIKFNRYKTITTSLYIMLPSVIIMIVAEGLAVPNIFCSFIQQEACSKGLIVLFWIGISLFFICEVVLMIGFVGFIANIIQFGLDQLHDMPGEDQSLFIHWIVWIYYLPSFISGLIALPAYVVQQTLSPSFSYFTITLVLPLILTLLLIGSLCVAHHRKRWFIIDPLVINPYKLVYKVTKFALQHKIPVCRSAFTYCEDELPSGLDLGKNKYGGPFTTEQVEDVKTFYGIAKVLFSFGTVFLYSLGASNQFKAFIEVNSFNDTLIWKVTDVPYIVISTLLPVICIPLYICLIRPISYYIPGMLKRMGIGMLLLLIALIYSTSLDTAYVIYGDSLGTSNSNISNTLSLRMYLSIVIPQNVLVSLANMILPIAVLEFICSQSPHSMKGLFIGLLIANYGLYWCISVFFLKLKHEKPFFHGGFLYYIVNIIMGVIFFVIFVFVAKKYKYRERDEPSNEHRYAEEYYSKLVDESNMED